MSDKAAVFGLPAEAGRWVYIFIGFVINLCLGSVYGWSLFRKPLEALFHVGATHSGLPYLLFLATFAVLMPITGGFLDRYGPRAVSLLGGILVGLGWMASKFAPNIQVLSVTYGIVTGIGVGIVYGAPIAVSTRWFPDKKGLAVGLTLAGFGLSTVITAPLMRMLIASHGPLGTFGLMGICFLVLVALSSLFLRFPPGDWKPEGWAGAQASLTTAAASLNTAGMLKTAAFYGLWLCFIIGTLAGLMAIGIASPVAQEIVKLDAAKAALLLSVFALFNGGGRPLFGWLTDKLTPRYAAILSFVIILLASLGMLTVKAGDAALYTVCFCGFWLGLGGWLAIAPTATAAFFGPRFYARNYGLMFTAYGMGAVLGTLMSGRLRDLMGSYVYAFYPTAILAVIGMLLAVLLLKRPRAAQG